MNTQKDTGIIISMLADAFYGIGEHGLAFAVRNMQEDKAEQLAKFLKQAGFAPKGQRKQS